jgi:epoxyqueuosine reductase
MEVVGHEGSSKRNSLVFPSSYSFSLCFQQIFTGLCDRLLNANKCISYLTLEHRSDFKEKVNLHGYLAGCDLCQTVCPYNANAFSRREEAFAPRPEILVLTQEKPSQMPEVDFRKFVDNSALERIKYPMWRRSLLNSKMFF